MIAAQADGARGWLLELLQVALAGAAVWVGLSAVDLAFYQRLSDDHQAPRAAPLACVISAPLTERVQAGRIEKATPEPVAVEIPEGAGELASALIRARAELRGVTSGARVDDVLFADIEGITELIGGELRQSSPQGPARLICADGIIKLLPFSRTVQRNFQPTDLPHPTRIIDRRLHVPVRGLDGVLPVRVTWDDESQMATLACGERRMKVAVPAELFEITIDRSDRTLEVCYAGERLVKWRCCTGKGNNSPVGEWRIQNKARWAPWITYEGDYIPGGSPRNPLGARWLGTTARGWETGRTIGIHGTNQPSSIGRRISGGCIRLTNAHSIEMYNVIPVGARVIIQE